MAEEKSPEVVRFENCKHPNAYVAAFGDGKVYRCDDCRAHIRPADVPPRDQGATVIGPILGWATVTLFLIALVLGAVASVTGVSVPGEQVGTPSPSSQCSVFECGFTVGNYR